jgi:hypothetical protein
MVQALDRGERAGRIACKMMRCIRIDLMCQPRPSMHASCSRRASLCLVAAAFTRLPIASFPLNTRAPLVRDLASVPAAPPTMGWHGQAKQPMLQSALSVLAVVTDTLGALPWTDAATRVWVPAVWPRSMRSGSSAQLASELVWRPPRHRGVAGPGKVRVSGADMDPLSGEEASLDRMRGRRSRPAADSATSGFGRELSSSGAGLLPRPCAPAYA